jgi:antirestriction protein ArdC
MQNLYQTITDQIVAELKAGVRPWVKPWSKTPGLNVPCNAVSGRPYSGINTLLLWAAHRHDWQPRFLTFKQALEAGGHVRKGEHGYHVVFVKDWIRHSAAEGEEETEYRTRFLKNYTVFNIAQCDGLPEHLVAPPKAPNPDQRDALIDAFIATTGAKMVENAVGDRACYDHALDLITVPAFKLFCGRAEYCAALFHELVHWTGHPSRIDRQLGDRFGQEAYAAEELIAELGAAFLCAEFAVDGFVQHAAYLEHYLKLLQDDPKAIFTAASKAQAAVDFLRQQILAEPTVQSAAPVVRDEKQLELFGSAS